MSSDRQAHSDFLVIGAGIAGLFLAARLSNHGRVTVLEAESAPGYHASGRSVAFAHFGLGEKIVRTLTAMSLDELAASPDDDRARYARPHPALHIARSDQIAELDALEEVHRSFGCDCERLLADDVRDLVPMLKTGRDYIHEALLDRGALKLDTDAMLQGHVRDLRSREGQLICGARVLGLSRKGDSWEAKTTSGTYSAPVLINAAGAWADEVARKAGVQPIGIEPRRRTVIAFAAPEGTQSAKWPFVKTLGKGFYLLPEGPDQLLASPQDEGESEPCDAAPEEIDIATIAYRIGEASEIDISRIAHSWAGLRSFTPDELPAVGFVPDTSGFFWFAGQGGYGFQTSPALAEIGTAMIVQRSLPPRFKENGITPELFAPERFARAT